VEPVHLGDSEAAPGHHIGPQGFLPPAGSSQDVSLGKEKPLLANRRVTMRKIKEMLRLHFEVGLSNREIARSLSVSHSTVSVGHGGVPVLDGEQPRHSRALSA
jgi:hypothetical protein